ncbi:hypothetical protein OCU04_010886 [Sclerotinia nivalis]|uniref:Uncharacterized protein n=1 Tax=Sclerotinia nivalis TaxID=352851 RepID=A0A9X0DG90_9HELO|nr:hypothetical protein OCU04_010886 [Sclerotinia nivalis]
MRHYFKLNAPSEINTPGSLHHLSGIHIRVCETLDGRVSMGDKCSTLDMSSAVSALSMAATALFWPFNGINSDSSNPFASSGSHSQWIVNHWGRASAITCNHLEDLGLQAKACWECREIFRHGGHLHGPFPAQCLHSYPCLR